MHYRWERIADGVHRSRLPFLDCGTTLSEANAIEADVRALDPRGVTHLVLTHCHFDHVLGSSAFADAAVHCAPEVIAAVNPRRARCSARAPARR